jgi:chromosome segregation ATPase
MSDSTRTKAEGTGLGTLVGAAVGAGIGALVAGGDGAAWGAGIGAVVGGGAGYWWGSTVAERKANYASEEDRLDGEIQVVAGYNNKLREYNQQQDAQISQMNQEIAAIKSRYGSGKVKLSKLQEKHDQISKMYCEGEDCKKNMNKELTALSEYQHSIKGTDDPQKVALLSKEIAALKQNIAMLDSNNRQMAQMVNSLSVRK